MINYLKVKNHKGVVEIYLKEMGQVNILCGKNNSGKTSILEALNTPDKMAIGKKIDDNALKWLTELEEKHIERLTNPHPRTFMAWFNSCISKLKNEGTIWYSDDKDKIVDSLKKNFQQNTALRAFDIRSPHFGLIQLIDEFFQNSLNNYKSILIPPKRFLETIIEINLDQKIESNGKGLINRLFLLKNQDFNSKEYKTYEKIYNAFKDVTGYHFNIIPNSENKLQINFSEDSKNWKSADDSGLGLSDTLVILSFLIDFDYTLVNIEEPESHLHPEIQKKILIYSRKIKSKQFIFSTHTNTYLNPNLIDRIFYVEYKNDVKVIDETSKSEILYNLGYSVAENLVSDVIILTEGPTDIPILRKICQWLEIYDKYNIRFWPLGGDIMSSLDLSCIAEGKKTLALVDNDPKSQIIRTRFIKNCKSLGIYCQKLERYSIENYFTLAAIKSCFNDTELSKIVELKPDESVDIQIGFSKKGKSIKSKNSKIIENMELKDIEGTDLYTFCMQIKKMCNSFKN